MKNYQLQKKRTKLLMTLSGVAIVAIAIALVIAALFVPSFISPTLGQNARKQVNYPVNQTLSSLYFPSQIGLNDQWTDAQLEGQFAKSVGNLTSQTQYVSVGHVYGAQLSTINNRGAFNNQIKPEEYTISQGAAALTPQSNSTQSHVYSTTFLEDKNGTGSFGATASWASTGDIRGLAVSGGISLGSQFAFLLPTTQTGTTNSLSVMNPSGKATNIHISVYGEGEKQIVSQGGLDGIIPPRTTKIFQLNTVAPQQKGVWIQVTSGISQIYAVVKSTHTNGATPAGVSFIPALGESKSQVFTANFANANATLFIYAPQQVKNLQAIWLTTSGRQNADLFSSGMSSLQNPQNNNSERYDSRAPQVIPQLYAHKVYQVPLKNIPNGAQGLVLKAENNFYSSVLLTTNASSSSLDFTMLAPSSPQEIGGAALVNNLNAQLIVANTSQDSATFSTTTIDKVGNTVSTQTFILPPYSTESILFNSQISNVRAIVISQKNPVVAASLSLTAQSLTTANIPQLASLNFVSLKSRTTNIAVNSSPLTSVRNE